ncbi:hypothetical protein [Nonomuraea longicatena]
MDDDVPMLDFGTAAGLDAVFGFVVLLMLLPTVIWLASVLLRRRR